MLGEDFCLLCLLLATEISLLGDILLHLHGLGDPVLGAKRVHRVLDRVQPLLALVQPFLQLGHRVVEYGQAFVKVVDEDETFICLLEDLVADGQLVDLVVHAGLLVLRQHLLQRAVGVADNVVDLLDGVAVGGCRLHPLGIVSRTYI